MTLAAASVKPTLDDDELVDLTRYKRSADQLAELLRQGFHRARIGRDGKVVLERRHYEAVCAGARPEHQAPKVRLMHSPSLR